jgi:hypothetical protein
MESGKTGCLQDRSFFGVVGRIHKKFEWLRETVSKGVGVGGVWRSSVIPREKGSWCKRFQSKV